MVYNVTWIMSVSLIDTYIHASANTQAQLVDRKAHHVKEHGVEKPTLTDNFSVLKKCRNKFKCLVYEILFMQRLKTSLNMQSHSIRAKLFYLIHYIGWIHLQPTTVYPSHLLTEFFFLKLKNSKKFKRANAMDIRVCCE